jgi:malonyl-CoA O-methyltransferase
MRSPKSEGADPFVLDARRVRRAFERAAASYDAAAVLQREIGQRMLERLELVKLEPRLTLDAGSGTGHALAPLAKRFPQSVLLALDIALPMLQRQEPASRMSLKRLFGRPPLHRVCADVASIPLAPGSVDFIWSNVTLQWCNDLPAVFAEWRQALSVGGLAMFSTFGPDTLKELRAAFGDADGATHVSRFTDMHDLGDMLVNAGFADPVMDMEMITLTYDSLRDVMRDLKAIGAHNATEGRTRGLTGKRRWQQVDAAYERFRKDGRLPATFEVVYGHAWKPEPKTTADGRGIVRFMKRP